MFYLKNVMLVITVAPATKVGQQTREIQIQEANGLSKSNLVNAVVQMRPLCSIVDLVLKDYGKHVRIMFTTESATGVGGSTPHARLNNPFGGVQGFERAEASRCGRCLEVAEGATMAIRRRDGIGRTYSTRICASTECFPPLETSKGIR